ncbi:MAG: sulfotransferase [Microcoleaceae cyanobacterium]
MVMPNFLLVGAAKAGTSAIYDYISQHPQIYMSPEKEPMFFAFEGEKPNFQGPGDDHSAYYYSITDLETYEALFNQVSNEVAIGEASALYLYHEQAPERIQHYIPKVKLVMILRHPVERAYSNFLHLVRDNREPVTDFEQAMQQEDNRIENHWEWFWHYRHLGLYAEQIKRYLERFDRSQIKIYLYEDFVADSDGLIRDCFEFLEVDPDFTPDTSRKVNASGFTKNKALHSFLRQPNPIKEMVKLILPTQLGRQIKTYLHNKNLEKPQLSGELKKQLVEDYFYDDIIELQTLIERDLSDWLALSTVNEMTA